MKTVPLSVTATHLQFYRDTAKSRLDTVQRGHLHFFVRRRKRRLACISEILYEISDELQRQLRIRG
jgi:hypothetical protein